MHCCWLKNIEKAHATSFLIWLLKFHAPVENFGYIFWILDIESDLTDIIITAANNLFQSHESFKFMQLPCCLSI